MKQLIYKFLICLALASPLLLSAQCAHDPRITGDSILCPNATTTFVTMAADSFQWYSRPFGGSTTSPVPGATSQSLALSSSDAGNYYSVDVSLGGCTERSPEVLLDGWVFALPYVISEGDFTIGGNGESVLCTGDTMYFILGLPYSTNIQWFLNGNPIPGAHDDTLVVTNAGTYTCIGAPAICPNFSQQLGVDLIVVETNCNTAVDPGLSFSWTAFPNPAQDQIRLRGLAQGSQVVLLDILGRVRWRDEVQGEGATIDITQWPRGTYLLQVIAADGSVQMKRMLLD